MSKSTKIIETVAHLIDQWCERRCLRALRHILRAWPLHSGLTDEWGELLTALERVRAFAKSELTEEEQAQLEEGIHETAQIVHR
ncbi:MAG: hypothetical protein ACRELY_16585 [Polyangiaceae bacterium]